ncbi:J domain-containing protein [Pseudomonas sp. PLMAX]|uniref:J domain-containing protein n=1 Tax=Pseudomonas sp. PLMAX TaxID=2201998 RepID=UPI0038B889D7
MKNPRNHYDNLKVDRTASKADIRKAYRRLASAHHPDRNAGCATSLSAMQCINLAYEVLSNERSRAQHDAWIETNEAASRQNAQQGEQKSRKEENSKPQQESSYSQNQTDESNDFSSEKWDRFEFVRPQNFDEKHYDDFLNYNTVMWKLFRELRLSYLTPELIYRSFLIDKQWGRGAPKTIAKAYDAITRGMDRPEDRSFDKFAGLYFNLAPAVQGALVTTAFFAFVVMPAFWLFKL